MTWSRRFLLFVILSLLGCAAAFAQSVDQLAFFQKDALTAYRYNPAIINRTGFVGVGGVSLNTRSNLGVTAFIYELDGKTMTGLNKAIPADLFLGQLNDDNHFIGDARYNLFSYGFARGESYHTVEVNTRVNAAVSLPKDLFVLLKTGVKQNTFIFSNTRTSTDSYVELAYGYARKVGDAISVGARAKLLVGLVSADARISDFQLAWGEEGKTTASFDARLDLTAKDKRKNIGTYLHPQFDPKNPPLSLPSGAGLAFDLGFLITPGDYLTLSASVVDLGFLCWFYGKGGNVSASFSMDDFMSYYSDDMDWSDIMALGISTYESIETSAKIRDTGKHTRVRAMPFSYELGLKYAMPFYDRLSVGLANHMTFYRKASFWDVRLGLDVAPLDWLDLTGHIGYATYGLGWGVAGSVRIERCRIHFALSDSFGGIIPHSSTHLKAWNRILTAGLTFDL